MEEQPTPSARFPFRLRSLRTQLLLWTTLPIIAALVLFSLTSVLRHRQTMNRLVEDRDRGVALAEASRLSSELDRSFALLLTAANSPGLTRNTPEARQALQQLASQLQNPYSGGLALTDAGGIIIAATTGSENWIGVSTAEEMVAETASSGRVQWAEVPWLQGTFALLVSAPVADQRVLTGLLPLESFSLTQSSQLLGTNTDGAVFVVNEHGQRILHYDPNGLIDDPEAISEIASEPNRVGSQHLHLQGRDLIVSYARVDSAGWTLVTAEDVTAVNAMDTSSVEVLPLGLLFAAVLALLAVSFGMGYIVRPMQELARRATKVACGDFDAVNQPLGGVQEVDDLRVTLAQMADRIRSYQEGMRDYLSAVTRAQEEERSRLARELHDETVQGLVALKQRSQMVEKSLHRDPARAAERLQELNGLIDSELTELRRLIGDLRPIYLEDLGFVPALEMLATGASKQHGLAVDVKVSGEVIRLAPDLELAAFRVVQEALRNVIAHAQAHSATIEVTFQPDDLLLAVRDDGGGFSPPDQPAELASKGHYGLMGMRERTALYGGWLRIESSPGQGTRITARLPIR